MHTRKHRIDQFERLVDLLTDLSTSEDDLSTDEDKQHDLRLHHAIDKTGEQFRFVGTEVVMATSQTLQADGELDVARTHDVLDLEIRELGIETKLLNDTCVFSGSQLRVILRLGTSNHHLAGGEDQSGRLRLSDTHDHGRETLLEEKRTVQPHYALTYQAQGGVENNTLGLYSAFLAWRAIVFKSKRQSRLTVATMFLQRKKEIIVQ